MTTELKVGDAAPDFQLPSDNGETVSLATLRGKKIVLFFYPKDNTDGCTLEAKDFSRLKGDFEAAGAQVFGMSPDSIKKHKNFVTKQELTVPLISDEATETLTKFGVWQEKSMYGRKYMGVVRTTVVIDANGRIEKIWPSVKVDGHAEEVLAYVKSAA